MDLFFLCIGLVTSGFVLGTIFGYLVRHVVGKWMHKAAAEVDKVAVKVGGQ